MKLAIKNYCEDESINNGLFLLDMPTGFGKTHAVLDYIFETVNKAEHNKKIFFITTLKKNLPVKELRERFEKAGLYNEFDEKFLFIDSNADCVIENLTDDVIKSIPFEIRKTDYYKKFEQDVKFVRNKQSDKNWDTKNIVKRVKEELRIKSEPDFRKYIAELLAKSFHSVDDRIYAINSNSEWQWLGKLYPVVFTRNKQILFLSADKFLARNTTIVEPSYMFYNSEIIKDAIIFIDEFDAVKETMLNNVIQNGLKDKVDFLELFKDIYSALHTIEFPAIMTKSSNQRMRSDYASRDLSEIIDDFKEKSEEIYNSFYLQFNHKTKFVDDEVKSNFLFQDHRFHSILNGNKNFITTEHDDKLKINNIDFVKEKPKNDNNNIFSLLGKLRGFVSYFQTGINILAINYQQLKLENNQPGEDEFTREASIRTILNAFRLDYKYVDYLTSSILISSYKSKNKDNIQKRVDFDLSVYEKGFRYYSFINDINHDMQSQIMMCNFQTTPEKILLRFCEKAKVIGISATATIPSVIGNFDIDYLKLKLQDNFRLVNEDDKKRLKKDFELNTIGYKNISINVGLISGSNKNNIYSKSVWLDVLKDYELIEEVFNTIENLHIDEYHKLRYVRIAKAFKEFIIHNDINSFLCLLTKHPKPGDPTLNIDVLIKIFEYVNFEHSDLTPNGFSVKKAVVQLDGEEYDDKKEQLINRLKKGEKIFVISVYQTIGAGQNLQYGVAEQYLKNLIKTNDYISRNEKDFDAIYLDKPTNIITNLEPSLSEESFAKYIFQHELFQQSGEIDQKANIDHIRRAFKCYSTQNTYNLPSVETDKNRRSYKLFATKTLIQAIGRICRTNLKNQNIYVFADSSIAEVIDTSVIDDRLLNREFTALLDSINCFSESSEETKKLIDTANLKSDRVNNYINKMLFDYWNESSIEKWKQLRSYVLKYPTISKENVEKSIIATNFYIKLPEKNNVLYYNQNLDYANNSISFIKTDIHRNEISQKNARLEELMNLPGVRQCFEERNWATEFSENDYIMTPALYNNIYKGALGEVVGWILFKRLLDINLESIKELSAFELFDYKVKNSNVFIDFKHWKGTFDQDNEYMINKINLKLGKCGGTCAIIVNIISDIDYDCRIIPVSNGKIISIPSLYIKDEVNLKALDIIRRCINELSN